MIPGKLNIVINPVSNYCDLNCDYCFHKDPAPSAVMTMDLARQLLEQVFRLLEPGGEVAFTFQGGEPTLAGLQFYQAFTALAEALCPPGCHIFWGIQTHGLHLDDHWIDLFVRYDFEVGISVDGYQSVHDEHREDRNGEGTWKRVRTVLRRLREKDVVVNALCVITKQSSRRPEMIYQSLRKMGVNSIFFCPCADPGAVREPWSLTPPHLAKFMCRVFDVWYEEWEHGQYCYVNLFTDYIQRLQGRSCEECPAGDICADAIIIDGDGSIFPCEKYDSAQYRLGTVGESGVGAALRSEKYQAFLQRNRRKPAVCMDCKRFSLCGGGCRHDWVTDRKGVHNPYCSAYKRFFLYAYPRLVQIANKTKET